MTGVAAPETKNGTVKSGRDLSVEIRQVFHIYLHNRFYTYSHDSGVRNDYLIKSSKGIIYVVRLSVVLLLL